MLPPVCNLLLSSTAAYLVVLSSIVASLTMASIMVTYLQQHSRLWPLWPRGEGGRVGRVQDIIRVFYCIIVLISYSFITLILYSSIVILPFCQYIIPPYLLKF